MYFRIHNAVFQFAIIHFDVCDELRNLYPTQVIICKNKYRSNIDKSGNNKIFFPRNSAQQSKRRYIIACLLSYGVAIVFTVVTGIFEASASRCSVWRPRFNEETCFFAGMYCFFRYWNMYHVKFIYSEKAKKYGEISKSFFELKYYVGTDYGRPMKA